jgi:hypothetical protein
LEEQSSMQHQPSKIISVLLPTLFQPKFSD